LYGFPVAPERGNPLSPQQVQGFFQGIVPDSSATIIELVIS
jgi:hypothetical protein